MSVHLYTNGAWTDSGKIYRNSLNLWSFSPNTTTGGVSITSENGVIKFANTATSSSNIESTITLPAGTYTLKANANRIPVDNTYACIQVYKSSPFVSALINNNSAVDGVSTFTIAEEFNVALRIRVDIGTDYNDFELRPTLNVGTTAIDFEPYNVVDWYTNNGHGYSSGAWS